MIAIVRRKHLRAIGGAFGVSVILLALLWFLVWRGLLAWVEEFVMGATILIAAGLIVSLVWSLFGNLNAGAHRHTRARLGARCRAMPAEEFDALLASSEALSDDR